MDISGKSLDDTQIALVNDTKYRGMVFKSVANFQVGLDCANNPMLHVTRYLQDVNMLMSL